MPKDQNGHTVHKGESCYICDTELCGFKDRGCQVDAGHKGARFIRNLIEKNENDGLGGETGNWTVLGNRFLDNGLNNPDSGDDVQITNPHVFEISGNYCYRAPNASIIICQLQVYKNCMIRWNHCEESRHGLAFELCGKWPSGLENQIVFNTLKDCEFGIFIYGQEPTNVDMKKVIDKLLKNNTFTGCQNKIEMDWS